MVLIEQVILYTLLPVVTLIVSGVASFFLTLGARVTSAVQHFAAGVVFVAVAVELLPDLMHIHAPSTLIVGFALGTALVVGLRFAFAEHEGESEGEENPASLLAAVGIDLLVDGFLVGISFVVGEKQGLLLTLALTLEVLFVGLSTVTTLQNGDQSKRMILLSLAGLAIAILLGAVLGAFLTSIISGPLLGGLLAFGAAALLYLVTEELLREAHEVPDTPLTTVMFFLGFLVFLVIAMVG